MKRGLSELDRVESKQKPLLKKKRLDEDNLPIIVNFVATTPILPQNGQFSLPLMTISAKWGCSQYAPNLFAANIIKIRDALATSTVLLFVSGIMVVVSGKSMNHARNVSQTVRLNIERTHCMMHKNDASEIYKGSLKSRTTSAECSIHNIVGHGSVGFGLDLQKLVDAGTNCWKWFPDLFPGAKGKIWLTDSMRCECAASAPGVPQSKRAKCKCNIKMILFNSGQVVITGGRTIEEINACFSRIRHLASSFESAGQKNVPRDVRFYKRLAEMMVPTGMTMKNVKTVDRQELDPDEALACVLTGMEIETKPQQRDYNDEKVTPLMKMAEDGRVEAVEMLIAMDPDQIHQKDSQGRTAAERLRALPNKNREIEKILKMIEN